MKKTIGIISGAGAFAGLNLYSKLLKKFSTPSISLDKDFPQVILHNYPFSSMDQSGVMCPNLARKEIEESLQPLISCDKIILACNSLHNYINDPRLMSLPLIGLEQFNKSNHTEKKALILCSESSKQQKIFGVNNSIIYQSDNLSQIGQEVILKKISGTKFNELFYMNSVFKEAKTIKATHIIVGCTELSMLNWNKFPYPPYVLDCVDLIVEEDLYWSKDIK